MTAASGRIPAVVIGMDSPTGLQTARLLDDMGVPVYGVADDPRHPCARTRACRRVVGADTGTGRLLAAIRDLGADEAGSPRVLIPCTDRSVLLLSRRREELGTEDRLVLPDPDVLERFLDKALFSEFAVEHGVPTPATRVLRCREDAVAAAAELSFPCALKPARKTSGWRQAAGAKLFRVSGPEELLAQYDRCESWARPLVAQAWVPGPDTLHTTCNAYFGEGGRMLAVHTSRKLRQWPRSGGQACLSESRSAPELSEIVEAAFGSAGFRGFAYMEAKRDPRTGELLVLEANVGRPTGRSAAARAAGVPLLEVAYLDAAGLPPPRSRGKQRNGVKWVHLRRDLQAAATAMRRGEIGPVEWLASLRGPRVHALFSLDDPAPFVLDAVRSVRKAAGRFAGHVRSGAAAGGKDGRSRRAAGGPSRSDHVLAGSLTVRLVDATPRDTSAVFGRLPASIPSAAGGPVDPDLTIRFVDRLRPDGLRHAEWGRVGFTPGRLYLLDGPDGEPEARIVPPVDGRGLEIHCRRGAGRLPPLFDGLLDLAALGAGLVPLHASAFVHEERGVIAAGPGHSGKTASLLAFAEQGARHVADDRVLLSRDGSTMSGLGRPLTVRAWHLRQLPGLRRRGSPADRVASGAVAAAGGLLGPRVREGAASSRDRRGGYVLRALRRRLTVEMTPEEAFGTDRCARSAVPDAVFVQVSRSAPGIDVSSIGTEDAARRLTALAETELRALLEVHQAWRFAFPGAEWTILDDLRDRLVRMLREALEGMDAYVVFHPNPCSLRELRRAMEAVLDRERRLPRAPVPDGGGVQEGEGDRRPRSAAGGRR